MASKNILFLQEINHLIYEVKLNSITSSKENKFHQNYDFYFLLICEKRLLYLKYIFRNKI